MGSVSNYYTLKTTGYRKLAEAHKASQRGASAEIGQFYSVKNRTNDEREALRVLK
jgi:hypothetical protein